VTAQCSVQAISVRAPARKKTTTSSGSGACVEVS
jgi:hypothetical protein